VIFYHFKTAVYIDNFMDEDQNEPNAFWSFSVTCQIQNLYYFQFNRPFYGGGFNPLRGCKPDFILQGWEYFGGNISIFMCSHSL